MAYEEKIWLENQQSNGTASVRSINSDTGLTISTGSFYSSKGRLWFKGVSGYSPAELHQIAELLDAATKKFNGEVEVVGGIIMTPENR